MIAYVNLAASLIIVVMQIWLVVQSGRLQRLIKRSLRNQDEQIRILRARIHMLEQATAARIIPFPREGRA
jgi:hypothetical protein